MSNRFIILEIISWNLIFNADDFCISCIYDFQYACNNCWCKATLVTTYKPATVYNCVKKCAEIMWWCLLQAPVLNMGYQLSQAMKVTTQQPTSYVLQLIASEKELKMASCYNYLMIFSKFSLRIKTLCVFIPKIHYR